MRVISGKYGRLQLDYPKSKLVRPTMDRVKESLFSMIGEAIVDMKCLSLFSGSGSLGFEALSRGAKSVVFVDALAESIKVIKRNVEKLKAQDEHIDILHKDVFEAIEVLHRKRQSFDFIFMDPPYHHDFVKKTLLKLGAFDILAPFSWLVIEHSKDEPVPPISFLEEVKSRRFGATCITICRKVSES